MGRCAVNPVALRNIRLKKEKENSNMHLQGLLTALNGTSVALSLCLSSLHHARWGGKRKKWEGEDQEKDNRVSTSEHDELSKRRLSS